MSKNSQNLRDHFYSALKGMNTAIGISAGLYGIIKGVQQDPTSLLYGLASVGTIFADKRLSKVSYDFNLSTAIGAPVAAGLLGAIALTFSQPSEKALEQNLTPAPSSAPIRNKDFV